MYTLYIALGYQCNLGCEFCPCQINAKSIKALELDEIKKMIFSTEEKRTIDYILLSGGEPTIFKSFLPTINFLSETNYDFGILSNSIRFSNNDFLAEFLSVIPIERRKSVRITTALHSFNKVKHDEVTNVEGSFEKSILGIRNLIQNGIHVNIKFLVTKQNYFEIKTFIDYCYHEFKNNISITISSVDFSGKARFVSEKYLIQLNKLTKYFEDALDYVELINKKDNFKVVIDEFPLCCVDPYYWKYFTINTKLSGTAHATPTIENVNKLNLDFENQCSTFFEACKKCPVEKYCAGIWYSTYKLLGENAVSPVLESK